MILDFFPLTNAYTVKVPRAEAKLIRTLMREHGLDFSQSASSPNEAVLFTYEPYAACALAKNATERARAKLRPMLFEIEESWRKTSNAHIKCPMDKELWEFQKADIEYALRRNNTLVGDQPGLGKTPIAICFANEIKAKRILVVCPANIRIQWVNRIREWSTMRWPYTVYPILSGRHGVDPSAHWTVVSYDLARTGPIGRVLAQGLYDLVVLDEVHYLKTIDSGRTHAIFGDSTGWCRKPILNAKGHVIGHDDLFPALAGRCGSVMGLSGTPLPNRPREAYTLARAMNFDAIDWMSEDQFKKRFNPSARLEGTREDGTTYMYNREEVGRAGELQSRLRANFMTRHLKREVMDQLNMPVFNIVRVEETKAVKEVLKEESLIEIDPETFDGSDNMITAGHIAVVRRQMGIAIAPQVAEYAAMCIDGGEEKIVIFAWHLEVLAILEHKLAQYGVCRIDGSTSAKKRDEIVNDRGTGIFQTNPRVHFLVGNTKSLGTGTDGLQLVCDHALLAEPEWVPGDNEQPIARLDRGGQKNTVQADLFVAPKSLLEKILASSLRKGQNTHKALDRRGV